jgi:MbtH protein
MNPTAHARELEYVVVINDEEQYSIWPAGRALPAGWRATECSGVKDVCLDYVARVWTDMRPLSLRRHLEAARAAGA